MKRTYEKPKIRTCGSLDKLAAKIIASGVPVRGGGDLEIIPRPES